VVFAHPEPVASLVAQGRVRSGSERDVARNTLVLVGRRATDRRDGARRTLRTLGALPEGAWLAIGEPRTVPAGKYAQALLESLGLWESLSGRMVFAKDVSAVLTYVRRGEAEVGLVYRTDVIDLDDVEVLDAPAGEVSGANARYVAAAVSPRAKAFVDFVATAPKARAIWTRHGFGAP
jgi:molybdate transport system substrate-binding protein